MAKDNPTQPELFEQETGSSLYRRRVQNGFCGECGAIVGDGKSRCQSCRNRCGQSSKRATAAKTTKYHRNRRQGLCGRCGTVCPDFCLCSACKSYVNQKKGTPTAKKRSCLKLCPQCGVPPDEGRKYCSTCRDQLREYRRIKQEYQRRKRLRLCLSCGSAPEKRATACNRCAAKATERKRYYKKKAMRQGLCQQCKKVPVGDKKTCPGCLEKVRIRCDERRKQGLCLSCNRPAEGNYANCEVCRTRNAKIRRRRKDRIFAAYGGYRCRCCGETRREFLQIDHINNDGYEHRKRIGKAGLYAWLLAQNFPPGFQVLCSNCNFAKGHFGQCPHIAERDKMLSAMALLPLTY